MIFYVKTMESKPLSSGFISNKLILLKEEVGLYNKKRTLWEVAKVCINYEGALLKSFRLYFKQAKEKSFSWLCYWKTFIKFEELILNKISVYFRKKLMSKFLI